jgi:hypothetical protein
LGGASVFLKFGRGRRVLFFRIDLQTSASIRKAQISAVPAITLAITAQVMRVSMWNLHQ